MKKSKTSIFVTIFIICAILAIIGFGVLTYFQSTEPITEGQAGGQGRGQGGGRVATTVRVTPVVRGTIENNVVINGDVMAANQISIFPTVGGTITRTFFQAGDNVRQGTVVAMVDPSRPGQVFSESPVVSTIGGTVLTRSVNRGDTVSAQTPIYVIGDLSSLVIETFVPERFSNAARRGLEAQVFLEALPGEVFLAVVDEVSPVLDPVSRTLRIRLRFQGRTDPRIRAGMFATVGLVTHTRQGVPIIPRSAAITTHGSWIVFTVDEDNIASRREISPGMENERFIEILNGLEIGDLVVSQGQNFLSHGELVRIVE